MLFDELHRVHRQTSTQSDLNSLSVVSKSISIFVNIAILILYQYYRFTLTGQYDSKHESV